MCIRDRPAADRAGAGQYRHRAVDRARPPRTSAGLRGLDPAGKSARPVSYTHLDVYKRQQSPWVLGTCGALAVVEFFADKIPGVDSVWDLLQTLARIPAGAFLAAATLSPDGHLGAGVLALGGGAALLSHGLKSGVRMLLNTSPEPFSNGAVSLVLSLIHI